MLDRSTYQRGGTRERLLETAEAAILAKGFAATSIDELIVAAGITKSGFFYHFRDKNELAKAILLRCRERDEAILDDLFRRGDQLNEDPLHGFLIALKLFAEMVTDLPESHPGYIAASICYQDRLFKKEIRDLSREGMLRWRERFRERFELIAARYDAKAAVDRDALADMAATLIGGGILLSRALQDERILPAQVILFREFVRLLFAPGDRY